MDATERFSDRADDYDRYRPGYPPALIDWMHAGGVDADAVVADIGAGTGILSGMLLAAGHRVIAVEPSDAMRARAEARFGTNARFTAVAATGEATGLPARSVDTITCAQAFHWLDVPRARGEFQRILRPGGRALLVWNERDVEASALMSGFEELAATWGTDYASTTFRHADLESMCAALYAEPPAHTVLPNAQTLDEQGLVGRFFSSSYSPPRDHPDYPAAEAAARALFRAHATDGQVTLTYRTRAFLGFV